MPPGANVVPCGDITQKKRQSNFNIGNIGARPDIRRGYFNNLYRGIPAFGVASAWLSGRLRQRGAYLIVTIDYQIGVECFELVTAECRG